MSDSSTIYRLAYVSKSTTPLTPDELRDIEDVSVSNNRAKNIYGVLVTDTNRIIQVLEGEKSAVQALMKKIEQDERHHSVKVFAEDVGVEACFKQWFMGTINIEKRPPAMRDSFRSMFNIFESAPILLSLNEQRIQFFRKVATWS